MADHGHDQESHTSTGSGSTSKGRLSRRQPIVVENLSRRAAGAQAVPQFADVVPGGCLHPRPDDGDRDAAGAHPSRDRHGLASYSMDQLPAISSCELGFVASVRVPSPVAKNRS